MVKPFKEQLFCTFEISTFNNIHSYFNLRRPQVHARGCKFQICSIGVQVINHMAKLPTQSVGLLLLLSSAPLLLLTTTKLKHFFLFLHLLQSPFFPLLLFLYLSQLLFHLTLFSLLLLLYPSHLQHSVGVGLNHIINFFGPWVLIH